MAAETEISTQELYKIFRCKLPVTHTSFHNANT